MDADEPLLNSPRARSLWLLRVVLAIAAVPPIVYGLVAITRGTLIAEVSSVLSRASVTVTAETDYLLKVLGLYILAFGLLLACAIRNPVKYRIIVTWGGLVFLGRALQRLLLTQELRALFDVPYGVNLAHVTYLAVLGLTLLWLRPSPDAQCSWECQPKRKVRDP